MEATIRKRVFFVSAMLIHAPYNGGVDAAARIHSSIAGPVMMRNTLPPLASNDLFGVVGENHILYATIANDSRTLAKSKGCARNDSVMFGQRIIHQFSSSFDGFANANLVGARDEYHSKVCFLTLVANHNWPALIWITDNVCGRYFPGARPI
jgi:hypothetical protein